MNNEDYRIGRMYWVEVCVCVCSHSSVVWEAQTGTQNQPNISVTPCSVTAVLPNGQSGIHLCQFLFIRVSIS